MQHRFDQLYNWLEENKPKVIVEIGTWNGVNAIAMLKSSGAKKYVGFDIWEEGNEYLDEIEFNAKKRVTEKDVVDLFKKSDLDFKYELIKGNTRETLPEYIKDRKPFADCILIDGGHSTPTIASDLHNCIQIAHTNATIFLDDYYYGVKEQNVGANGALGGLNAGYTVLPFADKVTGGGITKLARVDVRDLQIADRWDVPEDESWTFSPQSQSL